MALFGTDSGQNSLAYVAAVTHNIIGNKDDPSLAIHTSGNLDGNGDLLFFQSPLPIHSTDSNWPSLTISRGFFECAVSNQTKNHTIAVSALDDHPSAVGGWENEDEPISYDDDPMYKDNCDTVQVEGDGTGWDVGDIDLPVNMTLDEVTHSQEYHRPLPSKGSSKVCSWINNSQFIIDLLLAGSYDSAFTLLNRQVGVVRFERYKSIITSIYSCSRTSLSHFPHLPSLYTYPTRGWRGNRNNLSPPALPMRLSDLVQQLQSSYQLTTSGRFLEAVEKLQNILLCTPLLIVESKQDLAEAQQLIQICRSYILALKMETERKSDLRSTAVDQKRVCEMVAYFTHCDLQPVHQMLALRTAISTLFKFRNFKTARLFARRLLDLGPRSEVAQQFRKVLQACESNPTDEYVLDYDERNPFTLCGFSFRPIYKGEPEIKCPLCTTSYQTQYRNHVCNICQVSQIDKPCEGLKILMQTR